jgi:uncharacterized protein
VTTDRPASDSTLAVIDERCARHVRAVDGDAAHDVEHVRRVVANARRLAHVEGARLEIVVPAAWLHDCVAVAKDSPDRSRGSALAAAEASRLLSGWGHAPETVAEVAHAIEAHSFSAGVAPRTIEARVVQDADRLDALGALGLSRCLMLGGALGRPLYDPGDPFCRHRPADDRTATVDHFYVKLLRLADGFQTAAGRAEAAQRTTVLRAFLDALDRELRWSDAGE